MYRINSDKLEEVVGDTPYGRFLIDEFGSRDKYHLKHPGLKVDYNDIDRLHELIGILNAYQKVLRGITKEAMETPIEQKIEISKKALEAIKNLKDTDTSDADSK